jgi:NADH dehydrogenase
VIGGGPTGVEMAGAIAELARLSASEDFRSITPRCSRVILVEGGERLLPSFAPGLSAKARRALEQLGVEVRTGLPVSAIDREGVTLGNERIASRTAVWAAGVRASPAAAWVNAPSDRAGRVFVGPNLRVLGHGCIFAIGDTAACTDARGRMLPGVAPVAKQQGRYAARVILGRTRQPFRYRDYGNLATIGRHRAVIDLGRLQLSGTLAWLIWCTAHIFFLAGFRNRLAVGATWLWSYLTFERSARLITGDTRIS